MRLRKRYIMDEVKQVDEDLILEFTISTGAVDRDGDIINPDGWQLENYRRNPVVLFGHDYRSLPVATALSVWVENGKLKSRARFPEKDTHPFGHTVYQLCKDGFLKAASVGFRVSKSRLREPPARGMEYQEQELLEWSIVPIPANPEALIEARAKGIDLEEVYMESKSDLIRQAVELLQTVLEKLDVPEPELPELPEFLELEEEK